MKQTSFDKAKIKILLLEGVHQSAIEAFTAAGYEQIKIHTGALSQEELIQEISGAHLVGIRSRTQLNADVLAAANKLIAVGCFCIGTNQVDLMSALTRGIAVFNAPFSNTRSVAELVIAEAILLLRGIPEKNAMAHQGGWLKSAKDSYEIRGKTLGIIGYGNIGTQVSVLAESIGMRVLFHDAVNKLPLGNAMQTSSLKELLAASDVVTLHVPEDANTRWMMGPEELAQMKPGAVLINASRGTVVDIDALAAALASKHLAGAAIDVYPSEPRSASEAFVSPLQAFDNCILTPHVGGSTMEAQAKIGVEVAEKLIKFSDNGSSLSSVNFPEVTLPAHSGSHRILHVHQNIPGIMMQINQLFSSHNININAQYLQTIQDIGYVVTDIDQDDSGLALAKLQEIEGTLRARVLF
jgi:D-3-phosphoglycerate dehydrogenase